MVQAQWDEEAQVWVATREDVQGLAVEAGSLEHLHAKVVPAIQDLIELNGLDSDLTEIPVTIRSEQHATMLNPAR